MLLEANNIYKEFGDGEIGTLAINNVNFHADEGEFIAVTGPSGCGKSTLLNIIGLLDIPSEGTYIFNGIDVSRFKENRRSAMRKGKIGFVFQNFNLIDGLTVFENVELPLKYMGISAKKRREKVEEILDFMHLMHKTKLYPSQISGGQQQLTAIARAVVISPELIIADEPTGNLDSKNGGKIMNMLLNLNNSGTTIIMATHSLRDSGYAHRIVSLFDGQIINEEIKRIYCRKE